MGGWIRVEAENKYVRNSVRTYPFRVQMSTSHNHALKKADKPRSPDHSTPNWRELHLGLPAPVPKREILLVGDRPPFYAHPVHLDPSRRTLVVPPKLVAVAVMGHLGFEVVAFTVVVPQRDRSVDSDSRCARRTGARVPCRCERRPGWGAKPSGGSVPVPARWISMYSNVWRARQRIRTDLRHRQQRG